MNGSLRKVSGRFPEWMTKHLKGNTYVNLIFACSSGMRKLSRASTLPIGGIVWRGLGGVKLPDAFLQQDEGRGLGGVDFAYLSCTSQLEVAITYLDGKALPVIFKIQLGDIDRGCPVSFISQYPKEEELLIPAMSNIEITGSSYLMDTKFGRVSVYPARVNCNLKSMTLEEMQQRRQQELVGMLPYLKAELDQSLEPVIQALKENSKDRQGNQQGQACGVGMLLESLDVEAQIQKMESDFSAFSVDLKGPAKSAWLNIDENYKATIVTAIDFKKTITARLLKSVSGPDFEKVTGAALLKASTLGLADVVKQLLGAGANPGFTDGSNCTSAGGHYDPGQLEVSNYVCHANNATGCWKGDLRGKLGPISLAHPASAVTGVDRGGVELSEFIGRSVVVHATDGARIACGSVVRACTVWCLCLGHTAGRQLCVWVGYGKAVVLAIPVPGYRFQHADIQGPRLRQSDASLSCPSADIHLSVTRLLRSPVASCLWNPFVNTL